MTLKDGTVILDPAGLVREIPFKTWVYREAERLHTTAKALYNRISDGSYAMPKRRKVNSRVIMVPESERAVRVRPCRRCRARNNGLSKTNRPLYMAEWRNWRKALDNLWEQAGEGQFGGLNPTPECPDLSRRPA